MKKGPRQRPLGKTIGAGNRTRTGDINLGKVALYQLSYSRKERRRTLTAASGGVKAREPLQGGLTKVR
jgi:hypothetical protein